MRSPTLLNRPGFVLHRKPTQAVDGALRGTTVTFTRDGGRIERYEPNPPPEVRQRASFGRVPGVCPVAF